MKKIEHWQNEPNEANLKTFCSIVFHPLMFIGLGFAFFMTVQAKEIQITSDDLPEGNNAFFLGYDLDAIADFTLEFEGLSLCAYEDLGTKRDPATGEYIVLWSIGYGTPSYKGECITEEEARARKMPRLDWAVKFVHGYTGVIPQDHMTALADAIYNVGTDNYDYILRQYHHPERKKELTYALSTVACAWDENDVCVRYGGLQRRFEERINLLF